MTAPLLTTNATITCPHGGQGTVVPNQNAAKADGAPVCTRSDTVTIAGCPFTIGPSPSPCLTVNWQTASAASTAGNVAALTTNSVGLCMSAANVPQGPAILSPGQQSVRGT